VTTPTAQPALFSTDQATLFAGSSEGDVRKMAARARPWAHDAPAQRAKTALFARGLQSNVRKMAAGHFSS
jgi:hypothetical protein